MMKHIFRAVLLLLVISGVGVVSMAVTQTAKETAPVTTAAVRMSGEQVNWQVISRGASFGTSPNYRLGTTIGQTAAGIGTSGSLTLISGFWQDFASGGGDCCGLYTGGYTGNTNCDIDGKRNLADISKLIDRVYISKIALCCEANGNVNGDVDNKINLADISKLIDHVYISKTETAACE